mgnify:CR=1 FL=1
MCFLALIEANSSPLIVPDDFLYVEEEESYTEVTTFISYEMVGEIMRVDGYVNGFKAAFSYVPSADNTISVNQAEYYLANGYIDLSDIIGDPIIDGKIPIGNYIKLSIRLGDENFENAMLKVVSNDYFPLVFGKGLFPEDVKVQRNKSKKWIVITRKYYNN